MRESKVLNRILPAVGCVAAMSLLCAGSAHAALSASTTPDCSAQPEVQAFLAWGDTSEYVLGPDGTFANGAAGWSLTGGAAPVAGGDGYSLGGNAPSTESLSLPDGSAATTPAVCVGLNTPTIRFMAENPGSATSSLQVSATLQTSLGATVTLSIGSVSGSGAWSPSQAMPILLNMLPTLPNNETSVTFTFTPQGQGGSWEIDDFYVDPWTLGG